MHNAGGNVGIGRETIKVSNTCAGVSHVVDPFIPLGASGA